MRVLGGSVIGWALGGVGVVGCYPVYQQPQSGTESSSSGAGGSVTSAGTSGMVVTGGTAGSSSGSSGASTGGTSTGSIGTELTFILPPDAGGPIMECDPLVQDCPEGQKCTYFAFDGGTWWDSTKCVPVMDDPAGLDEPCFVVENGLSGIDNCDKGAMCWNTDADHTGTCSPLCNGTWEMLNCPSGWRVGWASSGFCICAEECDPLAQECEAGELCLGAYDGFICWYSDLRMDGQTHEPCDSFIDCAAGLLCVDPMSAVECDAVLAPGCCEPFCDLTKPNTCPGQGQVCIPYYEGDPPPGYEDVGVCSVPP